MAMAMTMTMAKQQRSKSNWVGMLRWYCLSAHSDGTHRPPPPPPAHSDGTHQHLSVLPKWIWEGMLKRWNLEQETHRPAHSDGTHHQPWRGEAQQPKYFHQREMATTKQQQQGGSNSDWEGMLKRWKSYQSYGRPPKLSEADVVASRVYEIAMCFKCDEDLDDLEYFKIKSLPPGQFEDWLDELQGYVECMELAHVPLFHNVLYDQHAFIRAKAAELVTTMVHNNPRSQQLVVKVKGLKPLLDNLTSDPDATSRTKALGAISALIRNNKPGITAFQLANGYAKLRDALSFENVRLQREVLNLIQYLLHENSSDCDTVTELGLPHIMMYLASSDDAEVREAALRGLLVLARDEEGGNSGQLVKNDDKLKQVLQKRIKGISAMAPEDLGVAREEKQLVDSLRNACYNEPSSFGEKGLLVLSGEDAPAPDVASKQFEPPLRAWAADRNSVSEKKDCNIVTELGLPCIMIHLASSEDAKVREAALKGLLVLARDEEGGNSGQLVKNDDKLKKVLQERIQDLGAAWEEIHLVDSLWNACYNEPSSLKLLRL